MALIILIMALIIIIMALIIIIVALILIIMALIIIIMAPAFGSVRRAGQELNTKACGWWNAQTDAVRSALGGSSSSL